MKEAHIPHPQLERVWRLTQTIRKSHHPGQSEAVANWATDKLTGGPSASTTYADLMIEIMATIQAIYGLAGRQNRGFFQSVFELMNLDLTAPNRSTLSQRRRQLTITLLVKD